MDVVVASSRGRNIKKHLPLGTICDFKSGGKLKTLTPIAKAITPTYNQPRRPHVYFLCGVPDISELVKSPNQNEYFYREAIYVEKPEATFERVTKLLDKSQRDILKHGALPVFATIPQFNIEIYNNYMLTDERPQTNHLHHTTQDYNVMQKNLMEAIDRINGYISHINKKVGASTPFLHDTVKQYRGRKGKRYYAYMWGRYRDGLHPGDDLLKKWAEVLSNTFRINREKDVPDEESSPKRAWKKTRFDN